MPQNLARRPAYWDEAKITLAQADPVLGGIMAHYHGTEGLTNRGNAFETLVRAVVGQQISVKAADSVWGKLSGAVEIAPPALMAATVEQLRGCGLSGQKVKYIQGIAAAFAEEKIHPAKWQSWDDAAIMAELIGLPGIGRWTAEMFVMFHLLRPNVLPLADLGLVKAFEMHYQQPRTALAAHAERYWQPYCTVATWYLWRSLDPVPVAY
ncbi:MAG: DNA-3-methyladenine glycosylase 2 family protein [Alphaproteobacteria bacterium]